MAVQRRDFIVICVKGKGEKNMVNNKHFSVPPSYVSFSQSAYDLFISATKIMTS